MYNNIVFVNKNTQMSIISYDGKKTNVGLLYPSSIHIPVSEDRKDITEKFHEQRLVTMSGLEESFYSLSEDEQFQVLTRTSEDLRFFNPYFREALNQFTKARTEGNESEEDLARQFVALGLEYLLLKGEKLREFVDLIKVLPRFDLDIKAIESSQP